MAKPRTKTLTAVIRAAADRPDELIVAGEVAEIRFPEGWQLSSLLASPSCSCSSSTSRARTWPRSATHRATMREPQLVATASSRSLRQAIHELHATTRLADRANPER